jgi:hypothetical protein
MKKILVNRIKIKCSKGRIEKGETVVLPDAEVQDIINYRADSITVLEDVAEPQPAKKEKTRKVKNAKTGA